jgi:hypothetical protein
MGRALSGGLEMKLCDLLKRLMDFAEDNPEMDVVVRVGGDDGEFYVIVGTDAPNDSEFVLECR